MNRFYLLTRIRYYPGGLLVEWLLFRIASVYLPGQGLLYSTSQEIWIVSFDTDTYNWKLLKFCLNKYGKIRILNIFHLTRWECQSLNVKVMHVMKTQSRRRVIILHNLIMLIDCPYLTGLQAGVSSEEKPQKNLNWNILILFYRCKFTTDNKQVLILITVPKILLLNHFWDLKSSNKFRNTNHWTAVIENTRGEMTTQAGYIFIPC